MCALKHLKRSVKVRVCGVVAQVANWIQKPEPYTSRKMAMEWTDREERRFSGSSVRAQTVHGRPGWWTPVPGRSSIADCASRS